jgi:hypothetical protein
MRPSIGSAQTEFFNEIAKAEVAQVGPKESFRRRLSGRVSPGGAPSPNANKLLSVACGAFDVPISKSLRRSSEVSFEHLGTHALERASCVGRSWSHAQANCRPRRPLRVAPAGHRATGRQDGAHRPHRPHRPDPEVLSTWVEPLRQGLRELGYVEGQNFTIEFRWQEGKQERLPGLLAELIALAPMCS